MADSLIGATAAKRGFHTLDGLRGVAAIIVVMLHAGGYLYPIHVGSAYLAVDLFFLISGFVVALAYEDRLAAGMGARRFLCIRLVRLYPLYILGTGAAAALVAAGLIVGSGGNWTWQSLLPNAAAAALMLPGPPVEGHGLQLYALNYPVWSLLVEIAINAVYALLFRHLRGALLVGVIIVSAAGLVVVTEMQGNLDGGWVWPTLWIGAVRVIFSFFMGVAAWRLYRAGVGFRPRFPAILTLALAAAAMAWDPPDAGRGTYDLLRVIVLFPLLLWLAVCNEPRRGLGAFAFLGAISYPLYVIHRPCIDFIDRAAGAFLVDHLKTLAPWIGLVLVAGAIVVSFLLARSYDVRARRRLGRLVGCSAGLVP